LGAREIQLHEAMATAGSETEKLIALDVQLRDVLAEKEDLEQQWLAAAEAAE